MLHASSQSPSGPWITHDPISLQRISGTGIAATEVEVDSDGLFHVFYQSRDCVQGDDADSRRYGLATCSFDALLSALHKPSEPVELNVVQEITFQIF